MNRYKFLLIACLGIIMPVLSWAQVVAEKVAEPVKQSYKLDVNGALTIVALLLLFPIFTASKTFMNSAKSYVPKSKKTGSSKVLGMMLAMMLSSQLLFAQEKQKAILISGSTFTYLLLFIILLEIIVIVFFTAATNNFIKESIEETFVEQKIKSPSLKDKFLKLWSKSNNFIPIEEEYKIDTGHSYDGIRELDNVTPPWFKAAFVMSIIFAIVYLYTHHVSRSAPLQIEEFEMAMAKAEKEKQAFLATQSNNIDENNVTLLSGADIEAGAAVFKQKCVACHEANGASKPGGVGPNLTDNNWIHGGSIKNIFTSIKNGYPDKGMISWKEQLTPKQMAQIASFIKSIKGSVTTGGKDPQGDIYTEEGNTMDSTNATKPAIVDSTKK